MASPGFEYEDEEGGGLTWLAPIRDLPGVFRRQYRWMAACLLVLSITTGIATALFPMRYEARGTILLTAKSIPDEFVPTTIIANILEQFEAIRGEVFTRASLTELIEKTGLYAEQRASSPMSALAAKLSENLLVQQTSAKKRGYAAPHSLAFAVTFAAQDPELAANVVNATVAALIDANIEYRSRQARITTEFMQREFDRADQALRSHERELAEFRANRRGSLPEEQEATLSKLERLEEQRRSAILRLTDYRARIERIDSRPLEASARPAFDALRAKLESARSVYTDDHPTVKTLERQLASMSERSEGRSADESLSAADREERRTIQDGIESEQRKLAQIDADSVQLEKMLETAPKIAEDYAALIRGEQILQENYLEYMRKLKNAELALSLESSQQGAQLVRLDSAIPPTSPAFPRWMIAAAGLLTSLIAALAIGLLREILIPVIIDQNHLEATIPLPCLGSISRIA